MSLYDDIRFFTDMVNPLADNLYKIALGLEALTPRVEAYARSKSPTLISIRLSARKGRVIVRGVFQPPEGSMGSLYKELGFHLILEIKGISNNEVLLEVARTGLYKPGAGRFDLVRWAGAVLPGVRASIVSALVKGMPRSLRTNDERTRMWFNCKVYLEKVPDYMNSLGDIRIVNVRAQENRILFYVNTNLIMVNLVDTFGPEYLSLEEIKYDKESMQMLWGES